jgi:hypothetical protein
MEGPSGITGCGVKSVWSAESESIPMAATSPSGLPRATFLIYSASLKTVFFSQNTVRTAGETERKPPAR